jgi:hypothetical protein
LEKGFNVSSSYALNRRQLLKVTGAGIVSVGAGSALGVAGAAPAHAAAAQFAGHKPGKIYLGLSNGGQSLSSTVSRTGDLGLRRTYYGWDNLNGELKNIKVDHAAGRLPWISFKPASASKGGWAAIAKGSHDAALRARARAYAGLSKPVIVTFNHEPHNDKTGTPAEFAKAWCRVHDIMKDETGLRNVISAPIIGEWVYNPTNRQQAPEDFITGPLLDRAHMLGVDLYQNDSGQDYSVRLGRVVDWLDAKGHRQMPVGLGETACSMDFSRPNGVEWWKSSWKWAVASGRVAAISYYNSSRNNTLKKDWVLWETSAKLQAYKDSLKSAAAVTL